MPKISLAIICKNSERTIRWCIQSAINVVDEIILLDSGSTDQTEAIAKKYNVRFVSGEWLGFGPQKEKVAQLATHDWILSLDSDEALSNELQQTIASLKEKDLSKDTLYAFPRRNFFLGRYLYHGEGYPDWCPRLFHRQHTHWSDDQAHEKLMGHKKIERLSGDILHHSSESLMRYLQKQMSYAALQVEKVQKKSTGKLILHCIFSPLVRFLKNYLLKKGFLDGRAGFVHCLCGALATFFKYFFALEKKE